MKHLFVPYETALQLKEKGFDEPCLAYYGNSTLTFDKHEYLECDIKANYILGWKKHVITLTPLYQQVIDWLWNNYRILIYPYLVPDKTNTIMWCTNNSGIVDFWGTKDQAIEEMLKLILK